jgi:hypothetical protein
MALNYHINPDRALIVLTRTHHPGSDESEAFLEGVLADPMFEPGFGVLDDRRGVKEVPSRPEVERMARWMGDRGARLGSTRWAIVVADNSPAAFGMARVTEALTSRLKITVRAFTDYEMASAWAEGKVEAT